MRLTTRIDRLEARVPKGKKRVILVWIGADGKTTKVADTDPHLPDLHHYDAGKKTEMHTEFRRAGPADSDNVTYRAARGGLARASTASSIEAVGALWANLNSFLLLVTAIVTAASAKP